MITIPVQKDFWNGADLPPAHPSCDTAVAESVAPHHSSQFSAKANFLRKKFSKRSFSDSSADRRPIDPDPCGGRGGGIRRGDAVVEDDGDDDREGAGGASRRGSNEGLNLPKCFETFEVLREEKERHAEKCSVENLEKE